MTDRRVSSMATDHSLSFCVATQRKSLRRACGSVVEQLEQRQHLTVSVAPDVSDPQHKLNVSYTAVAGYAYQLEWRNPAVDDNFHIYNGSLNSTPGNHAESVTGLSPAVEYDFKIRAAKDGEATYESGSGTTAAVAFASVGGDPPSAPTINSAEAYSDPYLPRVEILFSGDYEEPPEPIDEGLNWYDAVPEIFRSDDPFHVNSGWDLGGGGNFPFVGMTEGSYSVNIYGATSSDVTYSIRLRISNYQTGSISSAKSITIPGAEGMDVPNPPVLTVAPAAPGYVDVSWTDASEGVIYMYRTDGSTADKVGFDWGTSGTMTLPAVSGEQYFAVNGWVEDAGTEIASGYSNFVDAEGDVAADLPAAPDNLTATLKNKDGQGAINLLWDNVPNNETSYEWQMWSFDEVPFTDTEVVPGELDPDVTSLSVPAPDDWGWIHGMPYYFEVWSKNAAGESESEFVDISLPRLCPPCFNGVNADGTVKTGTPELNSNTSSHSAGGSVTGNGDSRSGDPALFQIGEDSYTIVYGPGDQIYFDWSETEQRYVGDFGITETLTANGGGGFVLTDASGNRMIFSGSPKSSRSGGFIPMTKRLDPNGNEVVYTRDGDGKITQVLVKNSSGDPIEQWDYEYVDDPDEPLDGLLLSVVLSEPNLSSVMTPVRSLAYTYYDGTDDHGLAGQLRTATLSKGYGMGAQVLGVYYYRYYSESEEGGAPGALKYVFGDDAYKRVLEAESETDPDAIDDEDLAPYADQHLVYDDSGRVTTRTVQGDGCSSCTGGQGTYEYEYEFSAHADGPNSWHYKTIETLPDGNLNVTYYNYAGQVMLAVFVNTTTNDKWGTFHKYDADGREILTASPSAVALPSSFTTIEAYADLLHWDGDDYQYLSDSAGQISLTEYYTSTTATESSAGGVEGYEQYRKVKNGETGSAILLSAIDYIAHDDDDADTDDTLPNGAGDDITIYLVDTETQYRNTNGTGDQTTAYDYTWYANSLQAASKTVTNPTVTTGQNGSNSATASIRYYDAYGRVQWQKDEGGFLTYNAYDDVTGGLLKQIVDVDHTETSDFDDLPSGWTTPGGGGLHLITTMEVDTLGRTTQVTDPNGNITYTVYDDPNHETRVYRGWNATTGATTGPIEVTRQDPARGYAERFTMSATPATSGSSGSYVPTGGESISSLQSLTRDVLNAAGQVVYRDVYTTSGLTYSNNVTIGTAGTDYLRTEFGYDWRGRQARVKRPDGTWTHTVYDGLGRVASVWKGTDNAGWTQTDPSNGGAGTNNMVKVSQNAYDAGGVGDGNLTESRQVFGNGGSDYYQTTYAYDFRGRMTDVRGADKVAAKYTFDNLGQQTAAETYADADTDFTIDSGERRGKTETAYDNRSQVFQSKVYAVDSATGTSPGTVRVALTTNYWYDARGNLIKTMEANTRLTKNVYDGAGRLYQTTQSADPTEFSSGTYADADDITDDLVYMMTEYWLDKGGRTRLETTWRRPNDPANTFSGTPTIAEYDHSSIGYWYDAADRLLATADYGRDGGDGGTRLIWASSGHSYIDADSDGIPTAIDAAQDAAPGLSNFTGPNDTSYLWIYTTYAYDAAGRLQDVTDNANRKTRTLYDLAGRKTSVIENYVNGTVGNAEYDSDRTTNYVYDSYGRLSQQIAKSPNGSSVDDQVTKHLYASDIDRSWLSYTLYPDSADTFTTSSGKATITSGSDHTTSTFDRLGRVVTSTDQRGVTHTYTYDTAGRLSSDSIGTSSLPSGVDGTVRSITYTYDDASRIETVSSKDAAGTVLNQIKHVYGQWGQVIRTYQEHDGAVNTGSTPYIKYTYSDGASGGEAKYVRLTQVDYPTSNGTSIGTFKYVFSTSTVGSAADYLANIQDGNSNILAQYQYLGEKLERQILHPQVNGGLMLNFGTQGGGYGNWDRFYRVKRTQWQNSANTRQFEDRLYTYDRMGNRLSMDYLSDSSDTGTLINTSVWDEQYAYDGLNRLTTFNRGTLSSGVISGVNLKFQQTWSLDALGNWKDFVEDADGYGGNSPVTQSRTTNAVNEITGYSANPESWAAPAYDESGNMTTAPKGQGSESTALKLVYDGWNRQAGVDANGDGDMTDANDYRYSYDGLGRRITKFQDTANDGTNDAGTTEEFYFNENYQVVEVRLGTVASGTKTVDADPSERYLWDRSYVDAPLMVELDTNTDGTRDYRLWPTYDANFNVTALMTDDGKTVERYAYTPYGDRTILNGDQNYANSGADPDGAEWAVDTNGSDFGFLLGHQGLRLDTETGSYYNRARYLNSSLGVFGQRDPLKYVDGLHLGQYERSNPITNTDPSGERTVNAVIYINSKNKPKTFNTKAVSKRLQEMMKPLNAALKKDNVVFAVIDRAEKPPEETLGWQYSFHEVVPSGIADYFPLPVMMNSVYRHCVRKPVQWTGWVDFAPGNSLQIASNAAGTPEAIVKTDMVDQWYGNNNADMQRRWKWDIAWANVIAHENLHHGLTDVAGHDGEMQEDITAEGVPKVTELSTITQGFIDEFKSEAEIE